MVYWLVQLYSDRPIDPAGRPADRRPRATTQATEARKGAEAFPPSATAPEERRTVRAQELLTFETPDFRGAAS